MELVASSELVPPVRWTRVPAAWLWSRRLTEPPRPCGMGRRTPPPAIGGHLPFQGGLCRKCRRTTPFAEGGILHHSLREGFPSFCGRKQRVAAKPPQVSISCLFRHDQRALRSPFGNLRPITPQTMWYPTLAGHGGSVSRRDRDRAHRRHAQLAGGTNDEERINSNASRFPEGSAKRGKTAIAASGG